MEAGEAYELVKPRKLTVPSDALQKNWGFPSLPHAKKETAKDKRNNGSTRCPQA